MGPIFISLIIVAAFAGLLYYGHRKVSIMQALQPADRLSGAGPRIKKLIGFGLLQSRMVGGDFKAGLMHATIFYGFMILLFRKIQLIIIGYDEFFVYPEPFGGVYSALKDFVELAVIVALIYAFFRRLVIKPKRLEPNREALFILSLIMVIMLTDLFYDGFKFALYAGENADLAHEAQFAFAGNWIAQMVGGLDPGTLTVGYHLLYWVQMITVFSFLVFLPIGEHFHVITALPALYFAKDSSPLNQVPSVDLESLMEEDDESEEEPKVGIQTAADLIWKDALDVFTCTECGRCKESCPTWLTDKPLSLKMVNDQLKHHLLDVRDIILSGEAQEDSEEENALPDLVGNVISEDTLWACTTCGYCETACPIELEHLSKFYKMRQHRVMMEGEFPEELNDAFSNYEQQSNPWGINSATRGDWAKNLDVPILEDPSEAAGYDYLFYVGSAQSFDSRNQKVAKAFVEILKAAEVNFAILGESETSTGECVRRAGNEMLFQELAAQLVETLNEMNVTKIVTCDPHAFNSLKNEYPEFGGVYQVFHHTQIIEELVEQGRLELKPTHEKVIYHEPCYLGRHNNIYDQPRNVLQRVTKDNMLEFDMRREKAMCCGAGGARMWMEETIGKRINVTRVEQALEKQPKIIATGCPYCTIMMTDGVAHHGKEEEIETKDIAELVAEALPKPKFGPPN